MTFYHRIILYFDGASRNNPRGPAGCGWVLYAMNRHGADGSWIAEDFLGYNVSNNQAEYQGLINGLAYIYDNISFNGLYIRGDSEIIIRQLEGEYQVRSPNIVPYYNEAMELLDYMPCQFYTFRHISRERNWEADQLANNAIDDYYY